MKRYEGKRKNNWNEINHQEHIFFELCCCVALFERCTPPEGEGPLLISPITEYNHPYTQLWCERGRRGSASGTFRNSSSSCVRIISYEYLKEFLGGYSSVFFMSAIFFSCNGCLLNLYCNSKVYGNIRAFFTFFVPYRAL